MQSTNNIALLNFNNFTVGGKAAENILKKSIILGIIIQLAFFESVLLGDLKHKVYIAVPTICIELFYIITLRMILKQSWKNEISKMFFQSCLINFGMMFTLFMGMPFIVSTILYYPELVQYYVISLFAVFLIAYIYTKSIDLDSIIQNSKDSLAKHNGKYNSIFFIPETLPYIFKRIPILAPIPYILSFSFALYAFIGRSGMEYTYALTEAMLILSALMFYSEFCYILLLIKYIRNKRRK